MNGSIYKKIAADFGGLALRFGQHPVQGKTSRRTRDLDHSHRLVGLVG
jgi:hypothetical protein